MKKTALVLLSTVFVSGVCTAEIYKWTDADGNIHYGDRPTADGVTIPATVERVAVVSRRTDPGEVQAGVDARLEREAARSEARDAAADKKAEAEKLQAEAKERATKCSSYRERMQKFSDSRRLYRVDDNGEREYLDDSQMNAARDQVREQVEEYCSS